MTYSDKELQIATEIAYFDLHSIFDNMKGSPENGIKVADAIEQYKEKGKSTLSDEEIERLNNILAYLKTEPEKNWKIVDYKDDNNKGESGFYGVVIDTGEGHIVSFRGSEDITDHQHVIQDWTGADLALVNSTLTKQQEVLNEWLKEISESGYIKNYDSIVFTGHSLGGNLAAHATIMSTFYENIFSRLTQSVNFDGPGFSKEYIDHYQVQIEQINKLLGGDFRHYQWSWVGSLLEKIPGINYETLATKEKEGLADYLFKEHSTSHIDFDGETAKRGTQAGYENVIGKFTEFIDSLPAPLGNFLVDLVSAVMIVATWDNKYFRTAVIGAVAVGTIALFLTGGIPAVIAAVGKVILGIAVTIVAAVGVAVIGAAIELISEFIANVITGAARAVGNFLNWGREQIANLIDFVVSGFARLRDSFNAWLESLGFAVAKPFIEVNTHKLRQYAERLENVRKRLGNIKSDMSYLYLTKGYLDLLSIINSNRLPSSWQIKRCINYLEDTADAFDKAERKILGQV